MSSLTSFTFLAAAHSLSNRLRPEHSRASFSHRHLERPPAHLRRLPAFVLQFPRASYHLFPSYHEHES